MSIPKNLDTINTLLEQASSRHEFDSTNQRVVFELGFLMGLLAKLMDDDSHIYSAVKHKVANKST